MTQVHTSTIYAVYYTLLKLQNYFYVVRRPYKFGNAKENREWVLM